MTVVKSESSQEHPPEIKTPTAAVKNESSQEHPPEIKTPIAAENKKSQILKKDYPIVGILILFILIIYSCVGPAKKSDHLSVWVRFPPQPDPVKVTVPAFSDYADVKKQVKDELSPSLDTKSLGEILLLSVQYGKVDVTAGVLASAQKNQKKKQKPAKRTTWGDKSSPPPDWRAETIASASQPLVVFVDNIGKHPNVIHGML
ncbi:hypothetical protein BC938DRAFT_471610 [Jimgerdemannia flammicorona]|uniref:Uncharacterized protein n=1 Tax=Jimgerdemannia flammicorona TaxID=994334 RepID=A0A433Q7Q0_9FUNG|nr:hypothetical protein BC938DRAFT_471610 [Jimgerdemannia flammicorona]